MMETLLKSFQAPDEVRNFPNGRFEIVHLGEVTFGRATYQPGWNRMPAAIPVLSMEKFVRPALSTATITNLH